MEDEGLPFSKESWTERMQTAEVKKQKTVAKLLNVDKN